MKNDDIVATGGSLSRNIKRFATKNEQLLRQLGVPLVALVVATTADGDERVRKELSELDWLEFDIRFAEVVDERSVAFPTSGYGWEDAEEMERAKAQCRDLGAVVYPNDPLGFGDQGLLVTFSTNCPNNSLPILHSPNHPDASRSWTPLFPRSVH